MVGTVKHWDRVADRYDAATALLERRLLARGRAWAVGRARGRVLEIGVGTGANLAHYDPGVRLTALDASSAMVDRASVKVGRGGPREVELLVADAGALPFDDAGFDAVVSTYVLCCVPDLDRVLAEALRVLRPGGDLLLADHVESSSWPVRLGQRALERVTVPAAEEHFTRRPVRVLPTDRVEVVATHRHTLGVMEAVHARRLDLSPPGSA